MSRQSLLSRIRDTLGFDLSTAEPFSKAVNVRCSQCQALCINGVPTHETGCPNQKHTKEDADE